MTRTPRERKGYSSSQIRPHHGEKSGQEPKQSRDVEAGAEAEATGRHAYRLPSHGLLISPLLYDTTSIPACPHCSRLCPLLSPSPPFPYPQMCRVTNDFVSWSLKKHTGVSMDSFLLFICYCLVVKIYWVNTAEFN